MGIPERIKAMRHQIGLTQKKLGDLAGVTKQAVSQWERGISQPERDALLTMQQCLGLNPVWVTHGRGPMFTAGTSPASVEKEQMKAVAHAAEEHVRRLGEEIERLRARLPAPAVNLEMLRQACRYAEQVIGRRKATPEQRAEILANIIEILLDGRAEEITAEWLRELSERVTR